ncbi:7,8-didemethyl-8-hydroxy-5-deazariboflavin synthase, CofG subunit [Ferroglobus placidus DSM 10642]|uniref:7,8-didemethyl-8-hydroxy-5-deazariboflavin synthase n=1 Tax=Ferroglobus placidus (strain DSM 10642 / AEDII12DO) TaxID=589924 RepID=D3S0I0_FERPA|nr:7,8-didemethyl-8-hydroxy-5-deazariboflavin synthase subunit CofG [Ferroglobus placidus]ADC64194.1 7,8-didemethyl-8-hydroxy-5-deazariboflavin synthase, CofG subunit [Ferroglobus placidus DSM 10642]
MVITYSRNVFLPLTRSCRNRCYYCGFRRENDGLMSLDSIISLLRKAKNATEALLTFGEQPEFSEKVKKDLKALGFSSFSDYVKSVCEIAIKEGFLPHTNPGVVDTDFLKKVKDFNASMGLMLEQAVELECHKESPGKKPEERIKFIKKAGKLKIPFTTGILVGIGEKFEDRIYSLEVIADLHDNYGHIQEVIIQNFSPKKGTKMENFKPPSTSEMLETVKVARKIIQKDVAIQVPPNLVKEVEVFVKAGANDLGGISDVTPDFINPEHPWPKVEEISERLKGYELKERLPIYPKFVVEGWYSEKIAPLIEAYSDEEGYKC